MPPVLYDSPICTNPPMDGGYLHLSIKNQSVTQQIQHMLHDATMQQPYFDYLQQKFKWNDSLEFTVHWILI